jgi:hypothetical protein
LAQQTLTNVVLVRDSNRSRLHEMVKYLDDKEEIIANLRHQYSTQKELQRIIKLGGIVGGTLLLLIILIAGLILNTLFLGTRNIAIAELKGEQILFVGIGLIPVLYFIRLGYSLVSRLYIPIVYPNYEAWMYRCLVKYGEITVGQIEGVAMIELGKISIQYYYYDKEHRFKRAEFFTESTKIFQVGDEVAVLRFADLFSVLL